MKRAIPDIKIAEARGSRVRYLRERLLGLSREQFCKNSKLTNHSLKAWELAWGGGLTESGAKKLVEHAKRLGIYTSCAWLMHDIGNTPTLITKDLEICEEEIEQIANELLVFRKIPGTIDTMVKDDAMQPFLHPGDYVGGIISKKLDDAIGYNCIVIDSEHNYYIRQLEAGDLKHHYHLKSLNPHPLTAKKKIENIKIELVAPIIWIRKPAPKS